MIGLLIGASGILGSNILMEQVDEIEWVPTYHRVTISHPRAQKLDLADSNAVAVLVEHIRPDIIVHVAGITKPDVCERDPELSYRINVLGTKAIAAAARICGARLIFLSTDLVFDGEKDAPYTEDDPTNPCNMYGCHKVQAEEIIAGALEDYLVIRTGVMYGWTPAHINSLAEWVVDSLTNNRPIEMFSDQFRNLTFVGDMVEFIRQMATRQDATGVIHFASTECRSKLDLGLEIAEAFGFDLGLIKSASASTFARSAKVPVRVALSVTKAIKQFGVQPRRLSDGVAALHNQSFSGYREQIYHQ